MLETTSQSRIYRSLPACLVVVIAFILNVTACVNAQQSAPQASESQRWAIILIGLPGDEQHAELFAQTADAWQKWLTGSLGFTAEHVLRLSAEKPSDSKAAETLTADSLRATLTLLEKKVGPNDTLWVFTLGHGHYDGQRAWFHLPGRDPSNEDFGRLLSNIRCREQVIWLTHSSSGWFVKPLSRAGRIVIAATAADDESNETEFPHALAEITKWPVEKLDTDKDQKVSIGELFSAVLKEVGRRFQSDKRLPTEHAQLDDNGDGKGTEEIVPAKPDEQVKLTPNSPLSKVDGNLAMNTFAPYNHQPALEQK